MNQLGNLNVKDFSYRTPLHISYPSDHISIIHYLIDINIGEKSIAYSPSYSFMITLMLSLITFKILIDIHYSVLLKNHSIMLSRHKWIKTAYTCTKKLKQSHFHSSTICDTSSMEVFKQMNGWVVWYVCRSIRILFSESYVCFPSCQSLDEEFNSFSLCIHEYC